MLLSECPPTFSIVPPLRCAHLRRLSVTCDFVVTVLTSAYVCQLLLMLRADDSHLCVLAVPLVVLLNSTSVSFVRCLAPEFAVLALLASDVFPVL